MPNGFTHEHNVDLLTLSYTSQGYPGFDHRSFYQGLRLWHVLGHRGYSPDLDWSLFKEPPLHKAHTPERLEQLTTDYFERFALLLSSNPHAPVNVEARSAYLALLSFKAQLAVCVGYYLYTKRAAAPWVEHITTRRQHIPNLDQLTQEQQDKLFEYIRPYPVRFYAQGLPYYEDAQSLAASCIYDISQEQEVMCSSLQLSKSSRWAQLRDQGSVFDDAGAGVLLGAMREVSLSVAQDVAVIRWHRP